MTTILLIIAICFSGPWTGDNSQARKNIHSNQTITQPMQPGANQRSR